MTTNTRKSTVTYTPNRTADAMERAIMAVERAIGAAASAPVAVEPIDWDTDPMFDDGYAQGDHTSRWIARMERCHI